MILYLSNSRLKNSVNAVYIKGLIKNGKNVEAYEVRNSGDYLRALKLVFGGQYEFIVIGYDSPRLVVLCRLFTRKKVIYNALCSVYERIIVARGLHSIFSLYAFYYWLSDFFAVCSADLVMLEADSQIDYFVKLFRFGRKKYIRAWTGVDEENFFYDPSINKFTTFTVLFRGALMPEAGAEYVIQAAKILEKEDIKFIMLSGGLLLNETKKLIEEINPKNLEFRSELLSFDELRVLMQKCHLSLGQLSDHPRLSRTVPHKAYESLAMKLPYLTASNGGVLELLRDGETCITCNSANAESLADKIVWAKNNYSTAERIAENGYELYKKELTSSVLAKKILDIVR